VPKDFNVERFSELLREGRKAFLTDSAYAIAIARPAGALAARRREKEAIGEMAASDVSM
jgi:hypothetical protein